MLFICRIIFDKKKKKKQIWKIREITNSLENEKKYLEWKWQKQKIKNM